MNQLLFMTTKINFNEKFPKIYDWWEKFYPQALSFLFKLVIALIIYWIGKKLIKIILNITKMAFEKAGTETGVMTFLQSLIKALLYAVLIVSIPLFIGMPSAPFITLVGSAGVTIGLALQGSLSNFAGGVLILLLKPFRVGDFIITNANEGTVQTIDIFYTKILTVDNRMVVLPNGALSNSNITNVTNEEVRRVDLVIPIGYHDDIKQVKSLLRDIANQNELVLKDNYAIDTFVANFGDSAVEIALRIWVRKENFLVCKSDLLETIKYSFDEHGVTIPFNQLDVTVKK